MRRFGFLLLCAICSWLSVSAFVPSQQQLQLLSRIQSHSTTLLSVTTLNDVRNEDFRMTEEQVNPIIRLVSMSLLTMMHKMNPEFDVDRELYDLTGKIWSRTWLAMTDSYPSFSGDIDRIRQHQGPCLYVANHASWLDIPIICTVLDPVFKFIAKAELDKVPCIGQQLRGGDHIMIDREDRRSQLKTFKDGIGWLKRGIPIMAFPEGRRSPDGRLMDFKGGLFSMAVKTKVPIIPITIGHANSVMPGNALFPVQTGRGKLHVHVHDAIDTEGKSDEELVKLVREAFLSTIPYNQHPLDGNGEQPKGAKVIQIKSDTHQATRIHGHATVSPLENVQHNDHHIPSVPFFIAKEQEDLEVLSK